MSEGKTLQTPCCIVGGGPAGVILGYLLARAGADVIVLEKHKDFIRDFRGDTVHPSTLDVIHELGLLDDFLRVPHQKLETVRGLFGNYEFTAADFRHLPTFCKFTALMPQWDFLNFFTSKAKQFPGFDLRMEYNAVDLTRDAGTITGVRAETPDGPVEIRADLVIACDGRHSTMRTASRLEVVEEGVPIDVLWFSISRNPKDPEHGLGNINYGRVVILINRGDHFQAGLIIRKGSFEEIKNGGLEEFRHIVRQTAPYLGDRVNEITRWDQVKLLSVQINRLTKWHLPGLLCIGDAAHAMSPAGGVGINLAIQDAIAAANLLAEVIRDRRATEADLARVQRRREFPTVVTQRLQVLAHKGMQKIFENPGPAVPPWQLKGVVNTPGVPHLMGRVIGIGVRPEHVRDPIQHPAIDQSARKRLAIGVGIITAGALLAIGIWKRRY